MRPELHHPPASSAAGAKMAAFHSTTVDTVKRAVAEHDVVVVGMAWNSNVKRARRALDAAGTPHHYLELGTYLNRWRDRLAVKLWSGWPTYPQVFVSGTFIGGADQTEEALAQGELAALLAS